MREEFSNQECPFGVEVGTVGDGGGGGVDVGCEGICFSDLLLGCDDGGHERVFAHAEAGVDGEEGGELGGWEIGA